MMKKYINNLLNSYNFSINFLLLIGFLVFILISYALLQNLLNRLTHRANNKLKIIENFIDNAIEDSGQIMYGLSLSLANESIDINNKNIINLIKNFDHKIERYKSIPFYGFKIIDTNNIVIQHSLISDKLFTPQKSTTDLELLENAKKNPFELEIGEIRLGTQSHQRIIPFCMAIKNNNLYKGALCSGLLVDKLSTQINHHLANKHINHIKLLGIKTAKDNHNRINNSFTLTKILKAYFRDQPLIIHQPLNSYPSLLEVEISCYYLSREIGSIVFYCTCYFVLFLILIYSLFKINKRFYQDPFSKVQKKLYEYSSNFIDKMPQFYTAHSHEFCPQHLSQAITHIIDYCAILHCNVEKDSLVNSAIELRHNILNLILTEHHYCSSNNYSMKSSDLYINELKKQINTKEQSFNLKEFLEEITHYCIEYYNELKINLILTEEDNKHYNFKHSALTEAIFNIFTVITRIGRFYIDDEIILKTIPNNNTLPNISIEILIHESSLYPLGWKSGPSYVHTGLLSTYLLAKENNLFFHIEEKKNKIIFLLAPIDNERLQNANELCEKLPNSISALNEIIYNNKLC